MNQPIQENKVVKFFLNLHKKYILEKKIKQEWRAMRDAFAEGRLSSCCGYYTYVYDRTYNFVGFIQCSKCSQITSYKKD